MKKILVIICSVLLAAFLLTGCGSGTSDEAASDKLVVGATAKPHAEILEIVKPMLKSEGVDLEIKVFTDYVLLNPALNEKQIDANFFQHIPYLDEYNAKNNTNLTWSTMVHNEPMGVYSKKVASIDKIARDSKIGIPNDATNGGRALAVLEAAGVIKLKEGAGITATDKDIV
ncbi:MAG: methionine ABC transporter substrate-binding protein, partial [Peptococcaceae bacterium]|nr:methionine ABC transporter substrate-binding protein [Peptococcaceae bacterium]